MQRLTKDLVKAAVLVAGGAWGIIATPAQAAPTQLYASPTGSGTSTCTSTTPCSLARAQAYVRTLTAAMADDIVVNLAGGTYVQTATWALTNADSGKNGKNVIWQASGFGTASPATVVISGGTAITGNWTLVGNQGNATIYKIRVSTSVTDRQLYVNGARARRTRSNNLPALTVISTGYTTTDATFRAYKNLNNIQFIYTGGRAPGLAIFAEAICGIASNSTSGSTTTLTMGQPCWNIERLAVENGSSGPITTPSAFENAYEMLRLPGQFYLDTTGAVDGSGLRTLYYAPRTGETLQTGGTPSPATVVSPTLTSLMTLTGTSTTPAQNIVFQGLQFSYATDLTASTGTGYTPVQSNQLMSGVWSSGVYPKAALPANITVTYAQNIKFERNVFTHLGAGALRFAKGTKNNILRGSSFNDVSGFATYLVGTIDQLTYPAADQIANNIVSNNVIQDIPVEYRSSVPIGADVTLNTSVDHNLVVNPTYSAADMSPLYDTPRDETGLKVTANSVVNPLQILQDGGGLYAAGRQGSDFATGAVWRGNFVRSTGGPYNALYLDESNNWTTVQGNVVYNAYPLTNYPDGAAVGGCGTPGNITIKDNYFKGAANAWVCGPANSVTYSNNTTLTNGLSSCLAIVACKAIMAGAGPEAAYIDLAAPGNKGQAVDDSVTGTTAGTWSFTSGTWTNFPSGLDPYGYYNGSEHYSNTTNDFALFRFTGTKANIYFGTNNTTGIAAVSVCDINGANCGAETSVDTYAAVAEQGDQLRYTTGNLAYGSYALKVRVTGTRNAASQDVYLGIDRADALTTALEVDDRAVGTGSNQISYGANWGNYVGPDNTYEWSNTYSNTAGATATMSFVGTGVQLYVVKDPANGRFTVSIDGGPATTIDGFAFDRMGGQLVFSKTGLTRGTHSMTIQVAGNRNVMSTDNYVAVDRVDVLP